MPELAELLSAFHQAMRCEAAVWTTTDGGSISLAAAAPPGGSAAAWHPVEANGPPATRPPGDGAPLVSPVPGLRRAWLVLGWSDASDELLQKYRSFLLPVVSHYLQSTLEVEHAANELAERYEEINLLYTITEELGRSLSLDETAATILSEVSETVGAQRGAILVIDRATATLQAVAALRVPVTAIPPIPLNDESSIAAAIFREQRPAIVDDTVPASPAESAFRRGTMLAVPITWTGPDKIAEPLGVIMLSARRSAQTFTAGDQKLVAAIATQIGTAIQNAQLVRVQLSQQRLVREMELAHDLQMLLLPRTEVVAPDAQVAARVVPAESVGGDFYNLFRLPGNRTGVMIADVSSHGYRAALIMALAMSASAIHAQAMTDPGATLAALLASLREELLTTEMFISVFYGVVDTASGTLQFANCGHPHAFLLHPSGAPSRLEATAPPLGLVEEPPGAATRAWGAEDTLLLFTDGVTDATDRLGARYGEEPVLEIASAHRHEDPQTLLARIFAGVSEFAADTVQRDDQTCVLLRTPRR
ncbi:MAG: GAF domain-containing SpoIIE family protein phosphatase [Gemmatimonadaceae bacterium]